MKEEPDRIRIRCCWIVAAALIAGWIGALASGLDPSSGRALVARGALWAPRVHDGQWWRLATSALVHTGHLHVAINVLGVLVAGTLVERRTGAAGALVIVIGGAAVSGAASLVWSPYTVTAGASGVVAALCGALAVAVVRGGALRAASAVIVVVGVAWGAILAATTDGVDHAAHAGGLALGVAAGALLVDRRGARPALLAAAIPAVATAALIAIATPPADVEAGFAEILRIDARWDQIRDGVGRRADGPRLARTVEEEVIAPLRAAAAQVQPDDRMPAPMHRRAEAIAGYAAARLDFFAAYVRWLDTGDPAMAGALRESEARVREAAARIGE